MRERDLEREKEREDYMRIRDDRRVKEESKEIYEEKRKGKTRE